MQNSGIKWYRKIDTTRAFEKIFDLCKEIYSSKIKQCGLRQIVKLLRRH